MEEQNASLEKLVSEIDRPFWRASAEARLGELRAEVEMWKRSSEAMLSERNKVEHTLQGALLESTTIAKDALLQVERYRKGLEDVLRTAPGIFVPASDTEPAFTCSCCRSKDGYVRGALGIAVAEKPKCDCGTGSRPGAEHTAVCSAYVEKRKDEGEHTCARGVGCEICGDIARHGLTGE